MVIYTSNYVSCCQSRVKKTETSGSDRPVMLALSNFHCTYNAVELAIQKAEESKKLIIVFGHKINVGLFFLESEIGLLPNIKEHCERSLITGYEVHWAQRISKIAENAETHGINVTAHVHAENFLSLCLNVARQESPGLIVISKTHQFVPNKGTLISLPKHLSRVTGCEVIDV